MGVLSPPRPAPAPLRALSVRDEPAAPAGAALAAVLRASHPASRRFEDGWRMLAEMGAGVVLADRDGERRVAGPGAWLRHDRPAVPPRPGDALALSCLADAVDAAGATWCAWSGRAPAGDEVVAFMWSAPAACAGEVVAAVGGRLWAARVGHVLRAPLRPERWRRAGALEVLVERRAVRAALTPLRRALGDLEGVLDEAVPPLARRLAPGLAAAEPPRGGAGFARHRADAVAAGLAAAAHAGAAARAPFVRAALAEAGIDPDHPHRLTGSRWDGLLRCAGW